MRTDNRIAEERRSRLRVLPGGLLEKDRAARARASMREKRSIRAWRIFFLGLFAGLVAAVMLAYVRVALRF